jgi:hypothetical protein
MAVKNKTLIEIAMFAVLEGMQVQDNDGVLQTITDLQVDLSTRRVLLKFANGDTRSAGLSDPLAVDVSAIAITPAHNEPQNTIQLNKPRMEKKKRD